MYTYQKNQILGGLCVMTLFLSNTLLADYRYVFVTDEKTAASNNQISYYDSFVQTEADKTGSVMEGMNLTWQVIGATSNSEADWAIARLDMTSNQPVEIRMMGVNGEHIVIANDYNDFWDGELGSPINHDQYGTEVVVQASETEWIWTGTGENGGSSGYRLGHHWGIARAGSMTDTQAWAYTYAMPTTDEYRLYAMSGVIQTVTPAPEPSTYLLLGSMLMVAVVCKRKKLGKRPLS